MSDLSLKISSEITIAGYPIVLSGQIGAETILEGSIQFEEPISVLEILEDIFKAFGGVDFNPEFEFNFDLKSLSATYNKTKETFLFSSAFDLNAQTRTLTFRTVKSEAQNAFVFEIDLQQRIHLPEDIPVIKDQLKDVLFIDLSKIIIATADVPEENVQKGMQLLGKVQFFDYEEDINLYLFQPNLPKPKLAMPDGAEPSPDEETTAVNDAPPPTRNVHTKWIEINKTLGPVSLRKIGFQFSDGKIWFLINVDIAMGGLMLSLQGLRIGSDPQFPPPVPAFGLDGIGVSLQKGPIQITGAFLKAPDIPNYYSGLAIIQTSKLSIDAFGGYGELPEKQGSAIFVFASVNIPIGGPAFFFVTGFSLGFGYNMAFDVPDIKDIPTFPLLNSSAFKDKESPTDALAKLNKYIHPEANNLWFAVGIQFRSFQLIETKALLVVDIGKAQLSILGRSTLVLPQQGKAFVNVKLGLNVFFKFEEGIFKARARIADGSYLIDPKCRVFGEFASFVWFKGPHAGDFVLSMGGYHPRFQKPAHYPAVERVGFDWPVTRQIQIKGNCYFALCSSAVMAGFRLEATYTSGALKAWFIALANLLLQWKPFHYDIEIKVSLGAKYKIFKLEIGANLLIKGPPISGLMRITWTVISFTIKFGAKPNQKPKILNWNQFEENFLPKPTDSNNSEVCRANIVGGLKAKIKTDKEEIWVVRSDELIFTTESVIPSRQFIVNEQPLVDLPKTDLLGIRPMGIRALYHSEHKISIKQGNELLPAERWRQEVTTMAVPAALWATTPVNPKIPDAKTVKANTGLSVLIPVLAPSEVEKIKQVELTQVKNFKFVPVAKDSPLRSKTDKIGSVPTKSRNTIPDIEKSLAATKAKRQELLEAVNQFYQLDGEGAIVDNLHQFASSIDENFQSEPKIGSIERVANGMEAGVFKDRAIDPPFPPERKQLPDLKLSLAMRQFSAQSLVNYTQIQQALFAETKAVNVYPGAFSLFHFNLVEKLELALQYNGTPEHPLQLITFDGLYRVISYELIVTSKTIPVNDPRITHLSLLGTSVIDPNLQVCGWSYDTLLPIANSLALIGEQFIIRPQAPFYSPQEDAASISTLLDQNKYLGDEDRYYSGWIDTVLFVQNPKEIVVECKQLEDQVLLGNAVQASIPYVLKNDERQTAEFVKIKLTDPSTSEEIGNYHRIKFQFPDDARLADWVAISIRVQIKEEAQSSWELRACYALCSGDQVSQDDWKRPDLSQLASAHGTIKSDVPKVHFQFKEPQQ